MHDSRHTVYVPAASHPIPTWVAPPRRSWTWLHHFAIWGSIAMWYIFMMVYGTIFGLSPPMWGMIIRLVPPLRCPPRSPYSSQSRRLIPPGDYPAIGRASQHGCDKAIPATLIFDLGMSQPPPRQREREREIFLQDMIYLSLGQGIQFAGKMC